jgi:hypothetical protein
MGTGSIPRVKQPQCCVDHPPPFNAEVKEREQLYLYSASGFSWIVLHVSWTLLLTLFLPNFNRTSVDRFPKNPKTNFQEIPSSRSRVVPCGRTDGRTDRHDEANSRYLQFCERVEKPKNMCQVKSAVSSSQTFSLNKGPHAANQTLSDALHNETKQQREAQWEYCRVQVTLKQTVEFAMYN